MIARPRLAFFGSSLVSCYWNGAATYYRGLLHALANRGFDITFYEPDAFERQSHRDIPDPDWARVVVYPGSPDGAYAALADARDSDFLVKASGVGVGDELLEAAVAGGLRQRQVRIFWDVDAPATLERVRLDEHDAFRPLVARYDLIFTYGGGQPVVDAYTALGARRTVPIYNALDPTTHFRVTPLPQFASALTFLGNRLPDREARVHEFFLRPAARLVDRTFLLGGAGWNEDEMPSNVRYVGHVGTGDHNSVNSSAQAVLNINRSSMATCGFSPPTRVFEAAGAGACVITDRWDGIDRFLEPGCEVLIAEDGDDVAALLDDTGPERCREIGAAAQRRVLASHTYEMRAADVIRALESNEG